MLNYDKLIPEMSEWNNGDGVNIDTWICGSGNFQLAIGYSTIFWPSFKLINGYVVRADYSNHAYLNTSSDLNDEERKSLESTANHLHLLDLHYVGCKDASYERLIYLGNILKEIYECKLKHDFPDRSFVVEFIMPDNSDDLNGYILTFYQEYAPDGAVS